MKVAAILGLILVVVGCGGVRRVNTEMYIPELDSSDYNDSYYIEAWKNLKSGKPKIALKNFEMSNLKDEKLYVGFGYAFLTQNKFDLAEKILEPDLIDDGIDDIPMGEDDVPVYICGPHDDMKTIIGTLDRNVGRDNYKLLTLEY